MRISLLLISMALMFASCENQDNEFPDFETQAVYFPSQYPLRTLELGDDTRFDNTIDLEHAFSVGVTMGGAYSNTKERNISFRVAPELLLNAESGTTALELLPESYYSLSSNNTMVIPKGEWSGTIRVDLEDAFFEDPKSVGLNYILPLVLTDDNTQDILRGEVAEGIEDPDRRITTDWSVVPKDFTLFAVKYQNKYHGHYLHRGVQYQLDAPGGDVINTTSYQQDQIVKDLVTKFTTVSLTENVVNRLGNRQGADLFMQLSFDNDGNVVVSQAPNSLIVVTGSGTYINPGADGADSWGEKSRRTISLDYTFSEGGNHYRCVDTFVFRDTDMKLEEYSITVVEP